MCTVRGNQQPHTESTGFSPKERARATVTAKLAIRKLSPFSPSQRQPHPHRQVYFLMNFPPHLGVLMPLLANSPSSPWSLAAQPALQPRWPLRHFTRRSLRRQQRALAVPNILLVLRTGFLLVPVGGRLGARGLGGNLGSHGVFLAKKTSVVLVEPGAWLRDLPGKDTAAAAAKGSFWP